MNDKSISKKEIEEEIRNSQSGQMITLNAYVLALASILIDKLNIKEEDIYSLQEVIEKKLMNNFINETLNDYISEGYSIKN